MFSISSFLRLVFRIGNTGQNELPSDKITNGSTEHGSLCVVPAVVTCPSVEELECHPKLIKGHDLI